MESLRDAYLQVSPTGRKSFSSTLAAVEEGKLVELRKSGTTVIKFPRDKWYIEKLLPSYLAGKIEQVWTVEELIEATNAKLEEVVIG